MMVDDNPGDVRLVREGLNESGLAYHMDDLGDGTEVLTYLRREGEWRDAPRPSLIFLDLRLPGKDGLTVLTELKRDPGFRKIPVVVWTSSAAPDDVLKSYDLGANCYVRKPADYGDSVAALSRISAFWFGTTILPPRG
jgi:CheY-like chemotaxis protein